MEVKKLEFPSLACEACGATGPVFAFDPDPMEGPITPYYQCPRCLAPISRPDVQDCTIILAKYKTNLFLQEQGIYSVKNVTWH